MWFASFKTLVSGWMEGWKEGWMDGWMDGRESGVKDCLQQSKTLLEFNLLVVLDDFVKSLFLSTF